MSCLMYGGMKSLFIGDTQRFPLDSHHYSISRKLKVIMVSLFFSSMNCLSDSSVNQVLNFSSGEARSHHSEVLSFNVVGLLNFVKIELEDFFSS